MKPRHFSGPEVLLILIAWGAFVFNFPARGQGAGPANEIRIIDMQEKAQILQPGAADWLFTQTGQVLRPGYRLRTPPNGRVSLLLSDQSVAKFGELTEIEYSPPQAPGGLRLFQGIFSFFHRDKPGRIQVITRGAAAGVKGTEFVMQVELVNNVERVTLSLIDGAVLFSNDQASLPLTNLQQAIAVEGQAPMLTAGFVVNNVLQWAFYYPAVLNLDELPLAPDEEQALAKSLADYSAGELLAALANYPAGRQPASAAERVYYAALLLSVGQAAKAEAALADVGRAVPSAPPDRLSRLATALRQLIAAVKREPGSVEIPPQLSTEFLAASYYEQSLGHGDESLLKALELARQSVAVSPAFGFGWARVAEIEFSFGRTRKALEALERSLELAPRNPEALTLKGFLLAAQNKTREALKYFDQAIAIDSALGNAWLGRGLVRIRRGDLKAGREDLLVAAAAEPQRSLLRSYLGKAYAAEDRGLLGLGALVGRGVPAERSLALHELDLAKELDPADPTAWLYSALVKEQQNRINEAIDDLERSKELNDNRVLYRSRLLLDQDLGVRSANLARIYAEAGMDEVAVREASRSVAADYANYSAHYFLANSYEALRRANYIDLRYETANFNEYLLANLLGPADGRLLTGPLSQQDYTRLFQGNYFGFSSFTEYLSRGAWTEMAVQYGTFGNTSYALEGDYLWDPGQNPNRQFEQKVASASFKQMLTPKDGLYVEVFYFAEDAEDIGVRYDPNATFEGVHTREKQEPTLLAGLDHQWNEANRTLFLASRINDSLQRVNAFGPTYLHAEIFGFPFAFAQTDLTQEYENRLTVDSFELQHLNRVSKLQTIAGIRYQDSTHRISNVQTLDTLNAGNFKLWFGQDGTVITNQSLRLHALRISPYIYEHLELADSFWLIGGISYDYQEQPRNLLFAPLTDEQDYKDQFSPKAGIVWTPTAHSAVRAAYTRSLGGVSLDQSIRLEPSQIAGFVQGYRDVIPASVGGGIDATRVETADLSLEHHFPSRTYVAVAGQLLRSAIEHDVGVWDRNINATGPGIQTEEELRYQERSLYASAHQLLGDWFTAGIRYRLSEARLKRTFPDIDPALAGANNNTSCGLLHTLSIQNLFRHPSGFFAGAEAVWWSQDLGGNLSSLAEDDFWQGNIFAGYRSPRRYVEITVGILNVTDEDYRIHPINLYAELPRERTFFTRLRLNF